MIGGCEFCYNRTLQIESLPMIDDLEQVDRLLSRMRAALPLPAMPTPELLTIVRRQSPTTNFPCSCRVTRVDYAGDEGGIMCQLETGSGNESRIFTSITHLIFAQSTPLAREIAAYQKHRLKRLRRLGVPRRHMQEYSVR